MKRIGLLGCGAIGTQIAIAIDTGIIQAQLTHIFDTDKKNAENLLTKLKQKPIIVENVHLLSSNPVDLIVVIVTDSNSFLTDFIASNPDIAPEGK